MCVGKLCVCVYVVCEQAVCEERWQERRREKEEEEAAAGRRTGVHNQNQEPHTKMWEKEQRYSLEKLLGYHAI